MTATGDKRSVLMAGPLPPAVGGMTSVLCDLEAKLRDSMTVTLFDTAKSTSPNRSLFDAIGARWRLWRRWLDVLRQARPTVVHIHTCSGLSYFLDGILLLLARSKSVPVILHIHGGRFDKFLDELNFAGAWFARAVARRAAFVVVLSDLWRDRLAARLPGARLAVIENGVPIPAQPGRASPPPLVLFLGTVCAAKGVEDLIRAASACSQTANFAIVGPLDDAPFVARMRQLRTELGLENVVDIAGPAHGAKKHEWLARAHVFVLPSHIEAFPISVLEAMAAGVPIVATAVGAIPSMIESEQSGLLVNVGDVPALSAAITRLLSDRALSNRLADNARSRCVERYSIERAACEVRRLYVDAAQRMVA